MLILCLCFAGVSLSGFFMPVFSRCPLVTSSDTPAKAATQMPYSVEIDAIFRARQPGIGTMSRTISLDEIIGRVLESSELLAIF